MYSFIGLTKDEAKRKAEQLGKKYEFVCFSSRFKDDIKTDSFRVVRQRLKNNSLELTVSDFKTAP